MTTIRTIDLETTGLEPPAEVCDVGLCDYEVGGKVSAPVSWLCGVREMPPEARAVHHISMAELAGKALFDSSLISHDCDAFAAHNAEFEMRWFNPPKPFICTYKAALRVWPDAPSHGNYALLYWLEDKGLTAFDEALIHPAHRAGPDALATAHILQALFQAGHTGKEMVAWTKEPRLLSRCPIGKFRGKPWSEVEAGFLSWMMRAPEMDADLLWNAARELTRRQGAAT